jgi:ParB family chromosome partitioning protein
MSYLHLALETIELATSNPRKTFYAESLEELAQSIQERGVLEPVVVRPLTPGRYELVIGERRYRACRMIGLSTIPALVRDLSDEDVQVDALLENFQREDLNPIEKARAVLGLTRFLSLEKTARTLGVSETTVRRLLDLLELPESVQAELVLRPSAGEGAFAEGHARALLALSADRDLQERLVAKVKAEKLTVAALEQTVRSIQTFPDRREIFLRAPAAVGEQIARSLRSGRTKPRPYRPQTARDHLNALDRQSAQMAELLDERVAEFLSDEEMNQLLAMMTVFTQRMESFTHSVRQAIEQRQFGFREVYIHCPLCGRIELIGANKCSVCWTILRRCVDCGSYDPGNARCTVQDRTVAIDDAECPSESSVSFRCPSYRPKFTPRGMPLPVEPARRPNAAGRRF